MIAAVSFGEVMEFVLPILGTLVVVALMLARSERGGWDRKRENPDAGWTPNFPDSSSPDTSHHHHSCDHNHHGDSGGHDSGSFDGGSSHSH